MGFSGGLFVVPWQQTEVEGFVDPPERLLDIGAHWRWHGPAHRLDGPGELLHLIGDTAVAELHRRAARAAARMIGRRQTGVAARAAAATGSRGRARSGAVYAAAADPIPCAPSAVAFDETAPLVLTDGRRAFGVELIRAPEGRAPLLLFRGSLPAADTDHWVVRRDPILAPSPVPQRRGGVICFVQGTWIDTPAGPRQVETLRPGDLVHTKDDGAQPVLWRGSSWMSGARLRAWPGLRPVRIARGAIGGNRPSGPLWVSPRHRLVIRDRSARALFGEPEVLVRADDLLDRRGFRIDGGLRNFHYVHLFFARHQVIWANGVEAESFYPGDDALTTLAPDQRAALVAACPDLRSGGDYGEAVRRGLSRPEAVILSHDFSARPRAPVALRA